MAVCCVQGHDEQSLVTGNTSDVCVCVCVCGRTCLQALAGACRQLEHLSLAQCHALSEIGCLAACPLQRLDLRGTTKAGGVDTHTHTYAHTRNG